MKHAFYLVLLTFLFLNCKNGASSKSDEGSFSKNILDDPSDILLGEFSTQPKGVAEFRISRVNDTYIAEVLEDGKWSDSETVVVADDKKLASLFGEKMVNHVETGLISKDTPFGIFKIDEDFRLAGDKPDCNYIVIFLFPLKAYKL